MIIQTQAIDALLELAGEDGELADKLLAWSEKYIAVLRVETSYTPGGSPYEQSTLRDTHRDLTMQKISRTLITDKCVAMEVRPFNGRYIVDTYELCVLRLAP